MQKILFVCTGNICRSPTAEAVARHKAKSLNLEKEFIFDSAGVEGHHVGEAPDSRSERVGRSRGISFTGIFSRKITNADFENFDLIMAMDRSHYDRLMRIAPSQHRNKIKLFLQFCGVKNSWNDEVIDPYYGSSRGFDEVFDVIDLAIEKLIAKKS